MPGRTTVRGRIRRRRGGDVERTDQIRQGIHVQRTREVSRQVGRGFGIAGLSIAPFESLHHGGIAIQDWVVPDLQHTHKSLRLARRAGAAGMRRGHEAERKAVAADEGGGLHEGRKILRDGHRAITARLEIP